MNAPAVTTARNWPVAAGFTLAAIAILLLLFYSTAASTVAIWERSETFAHGFLIFPISAYLIWAKRRELAGLTPTPDLRGLALLLLLGFGWLLANLAGVLVVEQLSLVAMIPTLVWIILGTRVVTLLAFPLGFLLFAVPMGEFLIPPLMEFTADFTVTALQLTGIPVFREGTFFTIPSGDWSVVEGCSGLRYLISAFTLGCLYAYLTYRSTSRRLIFAALSVLVPIIANGLRAYMIVMIAHLSDMKLAMGVDHYIYGWVFFGIVMLLLFWIGSFWREDDKPQPAVEVSASPSDSKRIMGKRIGVAALTAILAAALWPAYGAYLDQKVQHGRMSALPIPAPANGWQLDAASADWRPHYLGTDADRLQIYRKGNNTVTLYLGYYQHQRQGAELVNSQNVMVAQKHPIWSNIGESVRTIQIAGQTQNIEQTLLRSATQRLLIWNWNQIGTHATVNDYFAKLIFAKMKLLDGRDDGAALIVATPYDETPDQAAPVLQAFINDMLPNMEASLKAVAQP